MFIEQRHQAILDIIDKNGSISNVEIQEQFGVSYDSAKRDLRILEEKGMLKRTHGGAIPNKPFGYDPGIHELSAKERTSDQKHNYVQIAKKAVSYIEPKDVIYITNGSIGYLMAQHIPKDLSCTVITNSMSVAEELRHNDEITTIVTGGEMSKNGCFYDSLTLDMIQRFRFDKCFITSACISPTFGLSIQKTNNVGIINAILNQSKQRFGLYPTEKVGFESTLSICPANRLNVLITDAKVAREELIPYEEQGIEVIIAENE